VASSDARVDVEAGHMAIRGAWRRWALAAAVGGMLAPGLVRRERQIDRIIVSSILNLLGAATACG
jgi:hypothetical protein